jgi:transposase-like protein
MSHFKFEAALLLLERLVESGQSIAAAARTLGVVDQTLFNWVKANRQGKLTGVDSKPVSAEQMEIARRSPGRLVFPVPAPRPAQCQPISPTVYMVDTGV